MAGSLSSLLLQPSYLAALALICIQVGVGIVYRIAQRDGKYLFSASACTTISEFFKFLLSVALYCRECFARDLGQKGKAQAPISPQEIFREYLQELPSEHRYSFALLALLYCAINNTVFLLYRAADPGTIQLIKSGAILITALILYLVLHTKIVRAQWLAIILQVCGILVTQYHPDKGSAYPLSTYLLLLFQNVLSAGAGVYNQVLCKGSDASMHAMNIALYSAGIGINLLVHLVIRVTKPEEPGFFVGYDSWSAIAVIVCNVFIGIAMTAVYKYADAVIKCLATAVSTAILLYLSHLFFAAELRFVAIPATCVVFIAAWLYVEHTPKPTKSAADASTETVTTFTHPQKRTLKGLYTQGEGQPIGLGISVVFVVGLLAALNFWDSQLAFPESGSRKGLPGGRPSIIKSPLKKVQAFIRINGHLPERVPLLQSIYRPFFKNIHISMPNEGGAEQTFVNLTSDAANEGYYPYSPLAETMQIILDDPQQTELEGVLFFHFDAWIAPLLFEDMNTKKIWFPRVGSPKHLCMTNTKVFGQDDWTWFERGYHLNSMKASQMMSNMSLGFVVDENEFCTGWSDIFYIPRRFFPDFIQLGRVFYSQKVFLEIGVPTIVHIIDATYRESRSQSMVNDLACWGDCCSSNPTNEEILQIKCGHKLNLADERMRTVHSDRLQSDADLLESSAT